MGLKPVSGSKFAFRFGQFFLANRIFNFSYDQFCADFFRKLVTVIQSFNEIMTRINMNKRKGNFHRRKCLFCKMDKRNGIFAATEKQGRFFKLRRYFAHDENTFGF